jgi:hypothetical protein
MATTAMPAANNAGVAEKPWALGTAFVRRVTGFPRASTCPPLGPPRWFTARLGSRVGTIQEVVVYG